MTLAERATAVAAHGFTPRQARFLVTVMLHGGVCVQRQYCAFAGVVQGKSTRNFFADLTARRFATAHPCHGRANLLHVHHKGLYRSVGEPDSRYRRRGSLASAIEHLMMLDSVLVKGDLLWLATEREKVAYFTHTRHMAASDLPALTFESGGRRTVRYFPHKLPIGVASTDEVTFLYVVTETEGRAFRRFLADHLTLLRGLPRWRVLLVIPRTLTSAEASHKQVIGELWAAPVRPAVVEEFQWFCYARRLAESPQGHRPADADRYARARAAFGAPRFYAAYRRWLQDGDTSLLALQSTVFHDAAQRGAVGLDTFILPHTYADLSSVVRTV